jgi:5-deoxy-glucuronate isomerase
VRLRPAEELHLKSKDPGPDGGVSVWVTPESARWEYTSLTVVSIPKERVWTGRTAADEVGIVVLSGTCTIEALGNSWSIGGRDRIFAGKPWALYLPIKTKYSVTATSDAEIAICGARSERSFPPKLITPDDVEVEIRGAGNAARQINHIIKPDFPADRLLIVEVFTPSGNWSSFPPHKHDVSRMPAEADLEEIYYYRIDPEHGFGLQRLYTHDEAFDAAWVIHDGDLLLVPEGYHAFAVAQGYTGYYLNVLAGNESERTMQPADDPLYHWIRATWTDEQNGGAKSWKEIDERVNRGAGKRLR